MRDWKWRKNKKRLRISRAGINFWIDALAFLAFVICTVSGWTLMDVSPGENGAETGLMSAEILWGLTRFEWEHLHNHSGWIFVALVIMHLIIHWRWVSRTISGSIRPGREHENDK
jgi:hypothetical protein